MMEKGFTRTGRRSKYGAVRNSLDDVKLSPQELMNGGSEKNADAADDNSASHIESNADDDETLVRVKKESDEPAEKSEDTEAAEESKVNDSAADSEFHGFDRPSTPSASAMVNKLVGKYEAALEDEGKADASDQDSTVGSPAVKKMRAQDIYTDSEDENSKPAKEPKETKVASKRPRPLAKLTEEFDEKPASPPPAKRARKKSAKAREAAGDSLDNMRLLSDVSSEVTSSADVSSKGKALKDEVHSEVTSSAGNPTPSPAVTKKDTPARARPTRAAPDMSNPLFFKPLDMGWKRELVYRQTESVGGKRTGDIYYYTPSGKKVRSRVELGNELVKGSGLTLENFTFTKEPLGVDDISKEIIREASARRVQDSHTPRKDKTVKTPKVKATKGSSTAEPPDEGTVSPSGPPSATTSPAAAATAAATAAAATPAPASASPPKSSMTPRVVLKTPKQNSKPGPKPKTGAGRKSNADSPSSKAQLKARAKRDSSDEGDLEVGTLPPNWDAGDRSPANTTVTWKSKSSTQVPSEPCSIRCVGPRGVLGAIPTLQCRVCLCLYHPECVGLGPASETILSYVCENCHVTPKGMALVGGLTTWLPPSSTVRVQPTPASALTAAPAPPQTVATIAGQKFIVVPKHNVLSVCPAVGGVPAPPAPPAPPPGAYLVPHSAAAGVGAGVLVNGAVQDSESKKGKAGDVGGGSADGTREKVQIHHTMTNFMSELSVGYGALFHVMEYLKVQELLRASRVCRLWRDLSLHPKLWHTVRMKNSQVCDWDGFATALRARGTRVLDLRKMLAPGRQEDIAGMWKEFCRVIGEADNLQRVELSRCPANVVERLASSCPQLRVINAIAIRSEEVDMEPMRNVPLLEELRLKSTSGMSILNTLEPLKSSRLRHLSLTSIRNLGEANLSVVGDLHNLESLELGDCVSISADFGTEHLVRLKKLQRLRLEKGPVPECPVDSILEGISKLPALQQLEIINFDVKPGFEKQLAKCKQIQRLLIIPTYIITSASTNHIVLCSIPPLADSLTHLVWGLTQELTRVTDLFIDQCKSREGDGAKALKGNAYPGECIPIIKPVVVEDKEKEKEKKSEESGEEDKNDVNDSEKDEKMDVDEEKKEDAFPESPEVYDVDSLARGFRAAAANVDADADEQNANANPPAPTPTPTQPVSILPIPKLHKLLLQLLPKTRVKILKVPFPSTWRQTFPELSHFE